MRASAYGMASEIADGMDFFDVFEKAGRAIARARAGEGPTLLECKTYRYMGHYVGDPLAYRPAAEVETWKQRDALVLFTQRVLGEGKVAQSDLRRIDEEVRTELEEAVTAAETDPLPDIDELYRDVYVED